MQILLLVFVIQYCNCRKQGFVWVSTSEDECIWLNELAILKENPDSIVGGIGDE